MQGTPPEFGCCRPVDLIRGHSLADEVGVDEPRLVSVCPAIRLDDSDECLEELDIVGVADIVLLVINGARGPRCSAVLPRSRNSTLGQVAAAPLRPVTRSQSRRSQSLGSCSLGLGSTVPLQGHRPSSCSLLSVRSGYASLVVPPSISEGLPGHLDRPERQA